MTDVHSKPCRNCPTAGGLSEVALDALVRDYLVTFTEENCVSDELYRLRLAHCHACPGLYYGNTCRYCGCLVTARARRKDRHCPKPGQSKW
jgi:hypothetical protein